MQHVREGNSVLINKCKCLWTRRYKSIQTDDVIYTYTYTCRMIKSTLNRLHINTLKEIYSTLNCNSVCMGYLLLLLLLE